MTEEEYFRKNYPDSCYGDRLLSPYWDFFQDGVEFGERQSKKRIEDLKDALDKLKSVAEFQQSSNMRRHFEIKELEKEKRILGERCNQLLKDKGNLTDKIKKLIDFVLSKTDCCDVCPITDTCINSEGTCPYAGILAKGEKEVTREWLIQFISRR